MKKLVIPCLYLQYEKAVTGFGQRNLFGDGDVEALASFYSDNGADELLALDTVQDFIAEISSVTVILHTDEGKEESLCGLLKVKSHGLNLSSTATV